MRVPMSWLVELVPAVGGVAAEEVAARLTRAGLAVEGIESTGGGVSGPVVVGRVADIVEEPQKKKSIRWCQVDVSEAQPRGIVCGAANFAVGDLVAVALPGAVLPGGFAISARQTYGHVSDGMICSARELGAGQEAGGILVLPAGTPVGAGVVDLLGLHADTVLDVAVTPDRGYALSLRGIARETATAFELPFGDPGVVTLPPAGAAGPAVRVDDPAGCDRYVARTVSGLDPTASTPLVLQTRLAAAGMRPISLAMDVTNVVLLGLGQPLHAFDRDLLIGALVVRRAAAGERLRILDGVDRELDPADLVIADDSGPVALAGVMGGRATEVTSSTRSVLLEAAHFDPATVAAAARRHGLPSEASRRFERGVDGALAPHAAQAAVELLVTHGGATADPGGTDVDLRHPPRVLELPDGATTRKAGRPYDTDTVVRRLTDVGCRVARTPAEVLEVLPPSWRPDLTGEAELIEEVIRLEGYETVPSVLPRAVSGRGLPRGQLARRAVGRALGHAGLTEVVVPPFLGRRDLEALGLPPGDDRWHATALANPLDERAGLLRTTVLPGLLAAAVRNVGRGTRDVALFEVGRVFRPGPGPLPPAPRPATTTRPDDAALAALDAALPAQPWRVGVVLTGLAVQPGWRGETAPARAADWGDAVAAARTVVTAVDVGLREALVVSADDHAPWHPGRCAALYVAGGPDGHVAGSPDGQGGEGVLVGHAGELHPSVVARLGLPDGACAAELDLDLLLAAAAGAPPRAPLVAPYPPIGRDVALALPADVPAAAVAAALRAGAGPLLEGLRLFDRYAGAAVGDGKVSLAFRLTLRAADRTLTDAEANIARDAAVAATEPLGAVLRS